MARHAPSVGCQLNSLDSSDRTRAELIGRYRVGRIAGFLRRRMSGFESRSSLA